MMGIEARGLVKRYGKVTAVDGLDLQIEAGSLYALLGVNGAGKTTAMRMLCGLTAPDAGDAQIMGVSVRQNPAGVRRIVGISPQESAVAPKLNVAENLEMIAEIYGANRRDARLRQERMLAEMGLDEVAGRPAGKLSGGWQRRLSIAMALMTEPRVLILDEPTLGLDVLSRRSLWKQIEGLRGRMTILLSTHYMEEAQALADRIGILRKGTIAAEGSAEELMARTGTDNFEDAFVALAGTEAEV